MFILLISIDAFHPATNLPRTVDINQWRTRLMSFPPEEHQSPITHRRYFLHTIKILTGAISVSSFATVASPSYALVKGNAPPPKKTLEERKCRNVSECQEQAELTAAQQEEEMKAQMTPPKVTTLGTRYRDMESALDIHSLGPEGVTVQAGNTISVRYKVLKLGKRSYDGLIGEGTVIFSRGWFLFYLPSINDLYYVFT